MVSRNKKKNSDSVFFPFLLGEFQIPLSAAIFLYLWHEYPRGGCTNVTYIRGGYIEASGEIFMKILVQILEYSQKS